MVKSHLYSDRVMSVGLRRSINHSTYGLSVVQRAVVSSDVGSLLKTKTLNFFNLTAETRNMRDACAICMVINGTSAQKGF